MKKNQTNIVLLLISLLCVSQLYLSRSESDTKWVKAHPDVSPNNWKQLYTSLKSDNVECVLDSREILVVRESDYSRSLEIAGETNFPEKVEVALFQSRFSPEFIELVAKMLDAEGVQYSVDENLGFLVPERELLPTLKLLFNKQKLSKMSVLAKPSEKYSKLGFEEPFWKSLPMSSSPNENISRRFDSYGLNFKLVIDQVIGVGKCETNFRPYYNYPGTGERIGLIISIDSEPRDIHFVDSAKALAILSSGIGLKASEIQINFE